MATIEKWYILRNSENKNTINNYMNKLLVKEGKDFSSDEGYVYYPYMNINHHCTCDGHRANAGENLLRILDAGYTEISFEYFKENILKEKPSVVNNYSIY